MKLSLGPVQYYWPRERLERFYEDAAGWPVDVVYLGEVVCSRRHEMRLADWLRIAGRLRDAGKQVVLSTQVLLESGSDVGAMHRIVEQPDYTVEANDMGAVRCLAGKAAFVAGPHLNLYNRASLQWMAELGARRWVAPLELGRDALAALLPVRPAGLHTEVFAFGRLPLAISARCFTARHHNLPKDDCRFRCLEDPDGLLLSTREGEPFLVLNGVQTQSAAIQNLLGEFESLAALGVDVLRLSPHSSGMAEVVHLFDAARRGTMAPQDAAGKLAQLLPEADCNGYWHGRRGMDMVLPAELA